MNTTSKKILGIAAVALLISVALAGAGAAADSSGSCGGGLTWSVENNALKITYDGSGTGVMDDYQYLIASPWGKDITSVELPDGLTHIGNYAFYGCSSLTSVTIPDSVTSIGAAAFENCNGLTSVTIPKKVTSIGIWAFACCTKLTSITVDENNPNYSSKDGVLFNKDETELIQCPAGKSGNYGIPNSVTSIEMYAFICCNKLTSITIPDTVSSIEEGAFENCTGLTSVTIPDSVTSIEMLTFYGCTGLTSVSLGNYVTSIGSFAFQNCTGLTSVTIPKSVISIGKSAFADCSGLTSVTFEEGSKLETIGAEAFESCTGLTSITIPNTVTSIGDAAFENCTGLTSVSLGNGVTSIGSFAFSGCTGLTSITIPKKVTSIGICAFESCTGLTSITVDNNNPNYSSKDGVLFNKGETELIQCPAGKSGDYGIPNSVTAIGDYAFICCAELTSITIPNTVTSIGEGAFENCTGLTSITIPNTVTSIKMLSFCGCTGLTSVTIPDSVTSIGEEAFQNCSGLTSVTFEEGSKLEAIGGWAFQNCSGLTSVTIPNSVTSIGNTAFENCTGLTSVSLGNGVTSIGSFAFSGCTGLTSVTIPNSVTSIGICAFESCTGLTSITVDNNNPNYSSKDGVLFNKGETELIQCPAGKSGDYKIPNSVTAIGDYAFICCNKLTSIAIPDTVTSIGEGAFENCTGLTSIAIPDSVISIKMLAFYGCTGLTSVTIPESVKSIGGSAFSGTAAVKGSNVITLPVVKNGRWIDTTNIEVATEINENNATLAFKVEYIAQTQSSVTSFFGTKDGNDFVFKNAVVITKATLPGATYATVTNTSGSGWYTCNLSTDGTNGVLYFQVPLDVIDIKGYTINDVSLVGCKTTYLKSENGYAKYSAVITKGGALTIDFEKDAASAGTVTETPVATADTQGYLKITSVPAGAKIQIEGVNYIGYTPQEKISLNPGIYTVTLSLDGYEDAVKTVIISDDATSTVTADLKQKSGTTVPASSAKSPFPVLGILAGLGAATFFLRRR